MIARGGKSDLTYMVVVAILVEEDVVVLVLVLAHDRKAHLLVKTGKEEKKTSKQTSISFCNNSVTVLAASSVCRMCHNPVLSGVMCILKGRGAVGLVGEVFAMVVRVVLVDAVADDEGDDDDVEMGKLFL
jgi:hypothetical protein